MLHRGLLWRSRRQRSAGFPWLSVGLELKAEFCHQPHVSAYCFLRLRKSASQAKSKLNRSDNIHADMRAFQLSGGRQQHSLVLAAAQLQHSHCLRTTIFSLVASEPKKEPRIRTR